MKVALCGQKDSVKKIETFLSFSDEEIMIFNLSKNFVPKANCYFLCCHSIFLFEKLINQIYNIIGNESCVIVLDKHMLLSAKSTYKAFSLKRPKEFFSLNINRMFDLDYINSFVSQIHSSNCTFQHIEVYLGKDLPEYEWVYSVIPPLQYMSEKIVSIKQCTIGKGIQIYTTKKIYLVLVCRNNNSADIQVYVNQHQLPSINFFKAIFSCMQSQFYSQEFIYKTALILSEIIGDLYGDFSQD